jgi:hypothetical protein
MSDNVYKALKEQASNIRVDGELVEKTDEAWTVRLGRRVLRINRKDATEIECVNDKSNAISLLIAADAEIVESVLIDASSVHARREVVDWGPKPPGPLVDWGPQDECSVCAECTECSVCALREFRGNRQIGIFRRFRSSGYND